MRALYPVLLVGALFAAPPVLAQERYFELGPKLVAADANGPAQQGIAVAISADGNTALVGGDFDNQDATGHYVGATFVYVRVNGAWQRQGGKLVGTGEPVPRNQGGALALSADGNTAIIGETTSPAFYVFVRSGTTWSQQGPMLQGTGSVLGTSSGAVALSADGNTALIGSWGTGSGNGAAWVFTRNGGVWSQQGPVINSASVSDSVVGPGQHFFGQRVSLSSDGNTAMIGAPGDNHGFGAAWIFTRTNGVWSQQGPKLTGTGTNLSNFRGSGVALSGDGNTAILGAGTENGSAGAAWVYTRTGGVWSFQSGLFGNGGDAANAGQGLALALSTDGNTAIIGAPFNASFVGTAYMFTRVGGAWYQLGGLLKANDATANAELGTAVALSGDGKTAIVGATRDGFQSGVTAPGAAFVFTRRLPHDFGGDSPSDVIVRDGAGVTSMWHMSGSTIASTTPVATVANGTWTMLGTGDFDGDGKADIVWRNNATGEVWRWRMNGATIADSALLGTVPAATWSFLGSGDFDGDGATDLVWRNVTNGEVWAWRMRAGVIASATLLGVTPAATWSFLGTGDFDGDGKTDALWRNTATGEIWVWFMNGGAIGTAAFVASVSPAVWTLVGAGDFDGDGRTDLMWRDTSGNVWQWRMVGASIGASTFVANVPVATWTPVGAGDYEGAGKSGMLWRNTTTNEVWAWRMNGATILNGQLVTTLPATTVIERTTN